MRIAFATFATSIALIAAPAAATGMIANEFAAEIEHSDIDLTTSDGIALLDERVKSKIRQHCANGGRDLASIQLERECRASAFASVDEQVRLAIAEAQESQVRLARGVAAAPQS